MFINDYSDSIHPTKFTVLVRLDRLAIRVNTQPFNEYFSVRMRIILIIGLRVYVELFRVEINKIIRVVKYENDGYFEL